jgi:hypothetical protein
MDSKIIAAGIVFAGPNQDLKIALVVVFVLAVTAGIWSNSRIRKRIRGSGFPAWDPRSIIAALGLTDVLIFACGWIIGAGALLVLKNLQ